MIKTFRVKNYKALRDASLDLTPIHVLIGPNATGKTSILEAIAALCRSVDHPLESAFLGRWEGQSLVWNGAPASPVCLGCSAEINGSVFSYELPCTFGSGAREVKTETEQLVLGTAEGWQPVLLPRSKPSRSNIYRIVKQNASRSEDVIEAAHRVHDALGGSQLYRWNSGMLALPTAPDSNRRFRMEPSGFGLALCLDDILGYDRELFTRLETRFRDIFPNVKSIKLMPEPAFRAPVDDPQGIDMLQQADGKRLYFQFANGTQLVPAAQVSDGVLLVLAYLTILHLPKPPRVVLVEEPENGIHPKRLQDVLKILRDLVAEQERTQVILTTHSPYVVDLFKPEEVSVCLKDDDGSVSVHALSKSRTVREQLDVFTLGEIWTAEGDEAIARSSAPETESEP